MKVIYFGSPQFAADVLSYLFEKGIKITAVVTKPDRPKGRSKKLIHTPVKDVALYFNCPLFQPETTSDPVFFQELQTLLWHQYNIFLF